MQIQTQLESIHPLIADCWKSWVVFSATLNVELQFFYLFKLHHKWVVHIRNVSCCVKSHLTFDSAIVQITETSEWMREILLNERISLQIFYLCTYFLSEYHDFQKKFMISSFKLIYIIVFVQHFLNILSNSNWFLTVTLWPLFLCSLQIVYSVQHACIACVIIHTMATSSA